MTTESTETQAGTPTGNHAAAAQKPKVAKKATAAKQGRNGAATKAKSAKKATNAKKAAKAPKEAHKKAAPAKAEGGREGSKTAAILERLRRAKGATLAEIMELTSWQAHSVRGFISGTLGKKMGLTVNSAKGENGQRTYSLSK